MTTLHELRKQVDILSTIIAKKDDKNPFFLVESEPNEQNYSFCIIIIIIATVIAEHKQKI